MSGPTSHARRGVRLAAACVIAIALCSGTAAAFDASSYYRLRMDLFAATPLAPGDIVFVGDSITEGAQWSELFPGVPVRDRGIGGDTTEGVLARIDSHTAASPRAIFLLVGTNDLDSPVALADSSAHYRAILRRIHHDAPRTRVFVQSLLPRQAAYRERVEAFNGALAGLCREHGATWIDLYPHFLAPDGSLRDEYTDDELHLNGAGYRAWRALLLPHVESLAP